MVRFGALIAKHRKQLSDPLFNIYHIMNVQRLMQAGCFLIASRWSSRISNLGIS